MKVSKDKLLVRIPQWADWNAVHFTINDIPGKTAQSGDYLDVGGVKENDRIVVEFPIKERIITANLFNEYRKVTLKGNTVVGIIPEAKEYYPYETQKKYRANQSPMKRVTRFVSDEKFLF